MTVISASLRSHGVGPEFSAGPRGLRFRRIEDSVRLQIDNEYDPLEAVLVHRPGAEIERLNHENMKRFLFEDVPYLRRLQEEHDAFVEVMRLQGIEVVYLERLLEELMGDEPTRARLVGDICRGEGVPAIADELTSLKHWDAPGLTELLFAGLPSEVYHAATGRRAATARRVSDDFLLPPIPNAYFSRDPAVVVRDTAICSKMHYPARVRESLLVRAVLEHHAEFCGNTITYGGTAEPMEDRPYTIEGGDVIMLSPEAVLVGDSERTRSETIQILAGKCFRHGKIRRVYEVPIPTERTFMHLDTVFTIVDRGLTVWFSDVVSRITYIHRYEPSDDPSHHGARRVPEERTLTDILADEFDCAVEVVDTAGGDRHFAAREQRTDGANVLAIAPRKVITYDRNERTRQALEKAGVECLEIASSELVRGLGGPRCMTMPLRRQQAMGNRHP